MARKYFRGPAYALGERQCHYDQIDGFEAAAKSRQLPNLPELMGFGGFFVTQDVYQRAYVAVQASISAAAVAPGSIEHVIFCSSSFKERFFSERNVKFGKLLRECGVMPRRISGVSGGGCTDLLASVDIACGMLELGAAHNVLIVGIESFRAEADRERLLSHALISDAAVALIVSDARRDAPGAPEFEILAHRIVSDVTEIGSGMSITKSSPDRNFVKGVLESAGRSQGQVTKLFGNNVYLPIKSGREGIVGFTRSQMYLENVRRTGHCLGCDTILNLVDFGSGQEGNSYVLYSEAEGHAGCVALLQVAQ
jgi:3-oxoacyl-[acyl-carrier-protein] synthase III